MRCWVTKVGLEKHKSKGAIVVHTSSTCGTLHGQEMVDIRTRDLTGSWKRCSICYA